MEVAESCWLISSGLHPKDQKKTKTGNVWCLYIEYTRIHADTGAGAGTGAGTGTGTVTYPVNVLVDRAVDCSLQLPFRADCSARSCRIPAPSPYRNGNRNRTIISINKAACLLTTREEGALMVGVPRTHPLRGGQWSGTPHQDSLREVNTQFGGVTYAMPPAIIAACV